MCYIKSLYIDGFKKFKTFTLNFNEDLNILVGENEAGKSTILEALMIVLNQNYMNLDKTLLAPLFNLENIERFKNDPKIENLPKIYIEVELELDNDTENIGFYGENNLTKKEKSGISFSCIFDEAFNDILINAISAKAKDEIDVPYEFYSLKWKTFQGSAYNNKLNPFNLLFIDTSEGSSASAFYNYGRNLFLNKFEESKILIGKNTFREGVDKAFLSTGLTEFDDNNKSFRLNHQKIIIENIISIYDSGIPLENKGGGMKSIIKTDLALNKKSNTNLVLMEEPEVHLSHTNLLKMLSLIKGDKNNAKQLILTTHNDLIATHLDLRKVIWVNGSEGKSLKNVDANTANFFAKASDNNFLKFLLSKKVILVEGPTESLMIPYLYKKRYEKSLEEDDITIISCNGVKYKRYKDIDNTKKVAALIDNDNKSNKINESLNSGNQQNAKNFRIFTSQNTEEYTWEVCFYNVNKTIIDEYFKRPDICFVDKNENNVVEKMLKEKTEAAYILVNSDLDFEIPKYVNEAFEWIRR